MMGFAVVGVAVLEGTVVMHMGRLVHLQSRMRSSDSDNGTRFRAELQSTFLARSAGGRLHLNAHTPWTQ